MRGTLRIESEAGVGTTVYVSLSLPVADKITSTEHEQKRPEKQVNLAGVKVLLAEARTSLIVGATIALGTILGYSAMAGVVGGGGLGNIAIQYGYYRNKLDVMYAAVIILIVIVQVLQMIGTAVSKKLDKRITD